MVPSFAIAMQNTPYDWNFTTIAQTGLGGRSINYPRGHILGGSSSLSRSNPVIAIWNIDPFLSLVDGMYYTRGSSDDWDRFASVTKDSGWSWKEIMPYILKVQYSSQ